MNIIFAGTIGRSGLGGQAWASLQYLLGFRALGHDVLYLEDCGQCSYVFDWERAEWTYELDYPANYVRQCLEPFGLGNHWVYRTNEGFRGLGPDEYRTRCAAADLIIMRAVPFWNWRPEYDQARRRVFIDVDPGFTQIAMATSDQGLADCIGRADRRFTYGRRIGAPDCPIPQSGGPWLKTVPPVYLPEWPFAETAGDCFTSVVRWQGFKEASYRGVVYGQLKAANQGIG